MGSLVWCLSILATFVVGQHDQCLKDADVISKILNVAGNIEEPPVSSSSSEESSLDIEVGLQINYFNIIPHTSSLEFDGILTREWKHSSLQFSDLNPCRTSIRITHLKHKLWIPTFSFLNAIDITLHSHSVTIHLQEDGTITHSERVRQTIPCKTAAATYPFGNTTCSLIWRSDEITRDTARIHWKEATEFQGHEAGDLLLSATLLGQKQLTSSEGVHDELSLDFVFLRGQNKIILLFYLPSLIFMIIPWLSILLGPMAITRCMMSMISLILLTLTYLVNGAGLPETNGITAIDIWKLFSFLFVLGIIIELVIVTLMASFGRSRFCSKRKNRKSKYEMEPLYEEMNDLRERKTRRTCGCCRISALILDFLTFVSYSGLFAFFGMAYMFERDTMVQYINNFKWGSIKFF